MDNKKFFLFVFVILAVFTLIVSLESCNTVDRGLIVRKYISHSPAHIFYLGLYESYVPAGGDYIIVVRSYSDRNVIEEGSVINEDEYNTVKVGDSINFR